jgi:hypothetical protein
MKSFPKAGGVAALIQAALFLITLIFVFAILPSQGLASPEAFNDPARALASAVQSPMLALFNWLDVAFAVTTVIIVLTLHERLQADAPILTRLATTAGLTAAILLLLLGMIGFSAVTELARISVQNTAGAQTAYIAVNALINSLRPANTFAYGWWVLLVSWVALQARSALPKPLSYFGIIFGLMGIITFAVPLLGFLGIIVGLLWFGWLGMTLLRG